MTEPIPTVKCRSGCGRESALEDGLPVSPWTYLMIVGGYRCTECSRALTAAGAMRGTDGETADALPADSRGAIARATSHTVTPVAVSPHGGQR